MTKQESTEIGIAQDKLAFAARRLSAFLSGRFDFVKSRAISRRERRIQAFGYQKVHQFYARHVDKNGVSFDAFD